MDKTLGCHVQYSVMHSVSEVCASAHVHLPTKELLQKFPMHMMNRVLIPGRKKRV